jgi:hypothetical protein
MLKQENETVTLREGESFTTTRTVAGPTKTRGYKVHPLDEIVTSRKKKVTLKNDDGTVSVAVLDVPYKTKRYERYIPVVNLGKTYPFGSKRQGFNVDVTA